MSHPEHMAVLIGSFCISNWTNSAGTEAWPSEADGEL